MRWVGSGIALLLAAGCATVSAPGERNVALAPVLSQQQGFGETRERDVLYPFVHQHDSPTETGYGIRPFFYTTRAKEGLARKTTFLWPFGLYAVKPGEVDFRLIPLFSYHARYNEDGAVDRDWIVFPSFFFGTDKNEGDYFAFLPFYGTVRGLLGRDSMDFILFPLYCKTYDHGYEGLNFLFPLFAHGEGNDRQVEAVFPFYLRQAKTGRFDRRTYLWPFFHDDKINLNTDDPVRILAFWPLYGQEDSASGKIEARSYLWPFFGYRLDRGRNYTEYDLPWPFFRYLRSEKIDHTRVWPFWSRWENKDKHIVDHQVLWPIGWASRRDDDEMTKESLWILPLFWDHDTQLKSRQADGSYAPDGRSERYTHLWPLFHRKRAGGDIEFAVLSPWWFRDDEPFGFRDNYDPFFTLFFHAHAASTDESLTSVLGPMFRLYSKADTDWQLHVLPFRYEREGAGEAARREWAVLEGLVGYANDAGAKTLRLLWVPIRWGERTGAAK